MPYTKINPEWFLDLNVNCKIIQCQEENIRENLCDLGQPYTYIVEWNNQGNKWQMVGDIFALLECEVIDKNKREDWTN